MVGALVTAAVALAGGAPAEARMCPIPTPRRPTRIERYQRQRRTFGFRADRAYVRKLIRRGAYEYDTGYIPVTPRENRYLRLRDKLELGDRARRYLHARKDLSGGVSIEDGWPREPYVLVRLTRRRAHHTRALRRLARYPHNLRTKLVRISERQLGLLQDRIDWDAAQADGFYVTSTGPDIDTGKVDVELITRRADAAATSATATARTSGPR
jgi:hypothetical protein